MLLEILLLLSSIGNKEHEVKKKKKKTQKMKDVTLQKAAGVRGKVGPYFS